MYEACNAEKKTLIHHYHQQDMFIDSNQHFKYMENSCITIIYLHMYGLIIDQYSNLLPVDLVAQLVDDRKNIAKVRVQFPFRPFLSLFNPFTSKGFPSDE